MTYAELVAMIAAESGQTNREVPFVRPADYTGKPFRITDIVKTKGYKGKDVIRFTITCKDKTQGLMDMSVTPSREAWLTVKAEVVKAEGWMVTVKRALGSGNTFAWDFQAA